MQIIVIKIENFKIITNNMYNTYDNLSLYTIEIVMNNEGDNNNYNNCFQTKYCVLLYLLYLK